MLQSPISTVVASYILANEAQAVKAAQNVGETNGKQPANNVCAGCGGPIDRQYTRPGRYCGSCETARWGWH